MFKVKKKRKPATLADAVAEQYNKYAPMVQERVQNTLDDVTPVIQDKVETLQPKLQNLVETVEAKSQDFLERAEKSLGNAQEAAAERAEQMKKQADAYTKDAKKQANSYSKDAKKQAASYKKDAQARLQNAKAQAQAQHLAPAQAKGADAAAKTAEGIAALSIPAGLEKASKKYTGRSLKAMQKQAAAQAKEAAKEARKAAKQNARAQKGKGGLVFGLIVTAAVAGAAIWKAVQPIEDPWKRATVEPKKDGETPVETTAQAQQARRAVTPEPGTTTTELPKPRAAE
ncbi:hypothetical protein [Arthrobacter sp. UM1]|uniref:hypothetical protein n=1 Tax=Arthrobacter sp. UM1 TaxID=2766776 RepID=UPI001CF6D5D7|nr:hypothetical protein [Arthrobacter sp. UM1]MCB4208652.1 hypothetical protein [Arthrobacter sp. UM1]